MSNKYLSNLYVFTILALATITSANAHVVFDDMSAESDSFHTAKLRVMHGCGDAPTTEVRINIPDDVTRITPRQLPGWDVSVVEKTLDKPVMLHGFEVKEKVGQVIWTGGSLPGFAFEQFEMRLFLPDSVGKSIYFKVEQICGEDELIWDEIAKPGEDPWKLEQPAPFIKLTPTTGSQY